MKMVTEFTYGGVQLRYNAETGECWRKLRVSGCNNTSGYKGVSLNKPTGKWGAQIMSCGRTTYLGYFTTPEAAALAYDKAAKNLHGEFAKLNFN